MTLQFPLLASAAMQTGLVLKFPELSEGTESTKVTMTVSRIPPH